MPNGTGAGRRLWQRTSAHELELAASSGLAALALVCLKMRIWDADLRAPLSPGGDTLLGLSFLRNMQVSGWYQSSPRLGYPFGQDLTAYPVAVGDMWHLVFLRGLVSVASPALAMNLFYLLGYAAAAFVAFLCFRRLPLPRLMSWILSVLYALAPYHFLRGEPHIFLSSYFVVPLIALLALRVLEGEVRLRSGRTQDRRLWYALAICVLTAGLGLYYAVFALVLIAAAGLLRALAVRRWWPLVTAAALCAAIGVLLFVAALPNVLHDRGAGSVPISDRGYAQSEIYGLKIVDLLLPVRGHRIDLLAHLRERVVNSPIPGEGIDTLGFVAALGLVLVVIACLLPAVDRTSLAARLRPLGILSTVCVLTGTVAGVAALAPAAGFTQLRAWNRISIVISFLALAGVGMACTEIVSWWRQQHRGALSHAATAAVVLLLPVGLLDQVAPGFTPDLAGITAAWDSDQAYFSALEKRYGQDGAIFELPYVPFPENPPVVGMGDYEHLRGYLHSDMRWSYGAVKDDGRDWQPEVLAGGIGAALPQLAVLGFDAVYVNRQGFSDYGAAVEAQIRATTGDLSPIVNSTGALATYDLRPLKATLGTAPPAIRALITQPVRTLFGTGFYPEEGTDTGPWRWAAAGAQLTLVNPLDRSRQVRLRARLDVATPGSTVTLSGPNGLARSFAVPVAGVPIALDLALPPGNTVLQLTTDSRRTVQPDPRDLRQRVSSYSVVDREVAAATASSDS